jgi:hypothetical protein
MDDETVEMREDVPGMMRGSGVGDRGSVLDNTSKVIFPTGRFNANLSSMVCPAVVLARLCHPCVLVLPLRCYVWISSLPF